MHSDPEYETQWDDSVDAIMDLIREWEAKFPEEEMVVITLPKYDQKERQRAIYGIMNQLLKEKFEKS